MKQPKTLPIKSAAPVGIGFGDLLSRNRDFLAATPCVLLMQYSARIVHYDMEFVWMSSIAFVAHAGMGFCQIMANHHRDQMKRLNAELSHGGDKK